MEIDIREVQEGQRRDRVLSAFAKLRRTEVLSILSEEDPQALVDSLANILGDRADVQKVRWGAKDLPWILHVKQSIGVRP